MTIILTAVLQKAKQGAAAHACGEVTSGRPDGAPLREREQG